MCLVWFVLAERRPFDAIWKIINTSSRSHSISKVKGWSSNTVCHTNVPSVEFFSKKNDNNNKRRKKKEKNSEHNKSWALLGSNSLHISPMTFRTWVMAINKIEGRGRNSKAALKLLSRAETLVILVIIWQPSLRIARNCETWRCRRCVTSWWPATATICSVV